MEIFYSSPVSATRGRGERRRRRRQEDPLTPLESSMLAVLDDDSDDDGPSAELKQRWRQLHHPRSAQRHYQASVRRNSSEAALPTAGAPLFPKVSEEELEREAAKRRQLKSAGPRRKEPLVLARQPIARHYQAARDSARTREGREKESRSGRLGPLGGLLELREKMVLESSPGGGGSRPVSSPAHPHRIVARDGQRSAPARRRIGTPVRSRSPPLVRGSPDVDRRERAATASASRAAARRARSHPRSRPGTTGASPASRPEEWPPLESGGSQISVDTGAWSDEGASHEETADEDEDEDEDEGEDVPVGSLQPSVFVFPIVPHTTWPRAYCPPEAAAAMIKSELHLRRWTRQLHSTKNEFQSFVNFAETKVSELKVATEFMGTPNEYRTAVIADLLLQFGGMLGCDSLMTDICNELLKAVYANLEEVLLEAPEHTPTEQLLYHGQPYFGLNRVANENVRVAGERLKRWKEQYADIPALTTASKNAVLTATKHWQKSTVGMCFSVWAALARRQRVHIHRFQQHVRSRTIFRCWRRLVTEAAEERRQAELRRLEAALELQRAELATTAEELGTAREELEEVQWDLESETGNLRISLGRAESELFVRKEALVSVRADRDAQAKALAEAKELRRAMMAERDAAKEEAAALRAQVAARDAEIAVIRSGSLAKVTHLEDQVQRLIGIIRGQPTEWRTVGHQSQLEHEAMQERVQSWSEAKLLELEKNEVHRQSERHQAESELEAELDMYVRAAHGRHDIGAETARRKRDEEDEQLFAGEDRERRDAQMAIKHLKGRNRRQREDAMRAQSAKFQERRETRMRRRREEDRAAAKRLADELEAARSEAAQRSARRLGQLDARNAAARRTEREVYEELLEQYKLELSLLDERRQFDTTLIDALDGVDLNYVKEVETYERFTQTDEAQTQVKMPPMRLGSTPWDHSVVGLRNARCKPKTERGMLGVIADVLCAKMTADRQDDALGRPRDELPRFVRDWLKQKYGLKSIADQHLRGVFRAVHELAEWVPRVRLFGQLCGALDTEKYSPLGADFVCDLLQLLFTTEAEVATFLNRDPGRAEVPLRHCLAALDEVQSGRVARPALAPVTRFRLSDGESDADVPPAAADADASASSEEARLMDLERRPIFAAAHRIAFSPVRIRQLHGELSELAVANRTVGLDEFLNRTYDVWVCEREAAAQEIELLFRNFDRNRDGVLTFTEFAALIRESADGGDALTEREIARVFEQVNDSGYDDNAHSVTLAEFRHLADHCTANGIMLHRHAAVPLLEIVAEATAKAPSPSLSKRKKGKKSPRRR